MGSDLTVGLSGLPGLAVCALATAAIYLADPRPAMPDEWIDADKDPGSRPAAGREASSE